MIARKPARRATLLFCGDHPAVPVYRTLTVTHFLFPRHKNVPFSLTFLVQAFYTERAYAHRDIAGPRPQCVELTYIDMRRMCTRSMA